MSAVLSVRELRAGYQGKAVVHGLSLDVHEGEVVGLLGANGAGKTTTLLTLSGLIPKLGGDVDIAGGSVPPRRRAHQLVDRGVAHVPEDRGLFPTLTVEQHMRLGKGSAESIERAYELLPQLRPIKNRLAGLLSGGEQQMLAVAKALVTNPRLLMIDEMSLGLAPIIVQQLMPVVRRLADENGVAILLVEQHVELALDIADRAYILAHGELVMEEKASVLRRNPEKLAHAYLG